MNTYKIVFDMTSPVCAQHTVMFDGLLAYAYFQEHAPAELKNVGMVQLENEFDFSGMPIERHPAGYFMASWMLYEVQESAGQTHTFLKKWDEESDYMADFGKSRRAVHIDRGEFKTKQIPLRIVNTPRVWFYFRSEKVEEVARLIDKHIAGIGKKVSRGYGFFRGFTITLIEEDIFASQIMRPIPATGKETIMPGQRYEYRAWKPPYWHPGNFTICRVE